MTGEERRSEAREMLETAAKELMRSEGWVKWLETRAKFHHYSFGNQLLIAGQRPEATRVCGYKTWQSLNRQVLKGEHGIRIFAPMGGPCKACSGQGSKGGMTCGRCYGKGRWQSFRVVSVFDIAQTEGEDLPSIPYERLEGDSHAPYLATLEAFATSELGLKVTYGPTGTKGGWYSPSEKEIVVSEAGAPNQMVATLIHEIAHALGIDYEAFTRETSEVIVESVAFTVCRALGLDASPRSVAYVASWGSKTELADIKTYAETIDKVAKTIEAALGLEEVRKAA